MGPKLLYQCQNWSNTCIWRDLYLCYLSKDFFWLNNLLMLNLKISIVKVSNCSFIWKCYKISKWCTTNWILKTSTRLEMTGLLSIFVHILDLCLMVNMTWNGFQIFTNFNFWKILCDFWKNFFEWPGDGRPKKKILNIIIWHY